MTIRVVVVRCDKCTPPPGLQVTRYRWADGVLDPPMMVHGRYNATVTELRGDEVYDWWMVAADAEGSQSGLPLRTGRREIRMNHEIACPGRGCRNRVSISEESLATVIAIIEARNPQWMELLELVGGDVSDNALTITVDGLRAAAAALNVTYQRRAQA